MPRHKFLWHSGGAIPGPHTVEAVMVDRAGNSAAVQPIALNIAEPPPQPDVDIDIVTVAGTDPVDVKFRAGNTGKRLIVEVDAKHKGRVRVNGVIK